MLGSGSKSRILHLCGVEQAIELLGRERGWSRKQTYAALWPDYGNHEYLPAPVPGRIRQFVGGALGSVLLDDVRALLPSDRTDAPLPPDRSLARRAAAPAPRRKAAAPPSAKRATVATPTPARRRASVDLPSTEGPSLADFRARTSAHVKAQAARLRAQPPTPREPTADEVRASARASVALYHELTTPAPRRSR